MEHFPNASPSKEEREQQIQQSQATTKLLETLLMSVSPTPTLKNIVPRGIFEKSTHSINREIDPIRFLKYEQWNM